MGRSESNPDTEVPETEAIDCDILIAGGATNIWRPLAEGEGGVFRSSHAIGPCVDNNWLTLG